MNSIARTYGPAMTTGVLLSLGFPRYHLFPLVWLAFMPLLVSVGPGRIARGCLQFFISGLVFYLLLLQWLLTNYYWTGGWAAWGYLFLCLFMAAYWGLAGAVWAWVRERTGTALSILSLTFLWAVMEWLQGTLFSGFGWGSLAYSQGRDLPLLQWASVGGAPLIAAIVVAFNACVAELFAPQKHRLALSATAATLLIVPHLAGYWMLADPDYATRPLSVGIIQPNFSLEMKWDDEYTVEMVRNTAAKSRVLAQREHVDLFVWPESLVMTAIDDPEIEAEIRALATATQCPLFTGAQRLDPATGEWRNSSYLFDSGGNIVDYYDKLHLAPFGEYVPLSQFIPFVQKLVPAIGDVEPGTDAKVFKTGERVLGPLICFEVLFGDMAARLRAMGADVLVVITNLSWFGESTAIPQELEIARVRAVETRLPLIHSANSGISGVLDAWGRFTPMNRIFLEGGQLVTIRSEVRPQELVGRRLGGVLPVAAPVQSPVSKGPQMFPWVAAALSIAIILYAAWFGRIRKVGVSGR
ncbi:MAG: apolipoprotein N-acyltransferase [Candidatus Hydrogenedentes bacterium]|nr:apolipoprotein N-acyltransferase [Candidatus Hydrogenedentota bacterium]